jgi:hypothetical protein
VLPPGASFDDAVLALLGVACSRHVLSRSTCCCRLHAGHAAGGGQRSHQAARAGGHALPCMRTVAHSTMGRLSGA